MINNDPMLESYLSEIDSHLSQKLSASDKAETITKIKTQILELKEKQPQTPISALLKSMGEPREVANQYLSERGLAPVPQSQKRNIIKWLVIGFLGSIGLFLVFILILIFKFSSMISLTDNGQGSISFGGSSIHFSFGETEESMPVDGVEMIEFDFVNGDIDIEFSKKYNEFSYSCEYAGKSSEEFTFIRSENILRAEGVPSLGVECDLKIPQGIGLTLDGQNADVDIQLDPSSVYNINAGVLLGQIKNLPESDPTGVLLDIKISNGEISFH